MNHFVTRKKQSNVMTDIGCFLTDLTKLLKEDWQTVTDIEVV